MNNKTAARPNIIWIIPDDTNHRMLGFGGGTLSPNIDTIAREGVVFNQFHATSPACAPSRYSYLTGHYGGRCPVKDFQRQGPHDEPYQLFFNTKIDPDKERTVGHALRHAGYRTGHVGKWHTGANPEDDARIQHFNPDDDPRDPGVNARLKEQQKRLCEIVRNAGFDYAHSVIWGNHESLPQKARDHNIEWITFGALKFIEESARENAPFFLSMATTTIHGPNHVSSLLADPYLTGGGYTDEHIGCQASRQSIYDRISKVKGVSFNSTTAGVLWMDDAVAAVLGKLRELGIEGNTVVIFSGDHGPSLGGKFTTYDRGTRIPFAARWPDRIPAGRKVDGLAQNIDFLPTLMDIAKTNVLPDMVVDGKSFLPMMLGDRNDIAGRDDIYFEFGYTRAVRTKRWKYIAWRLPPSIIQRLESGEWDALCSHVGRPIAIDPRQPQLICGSLLRYPNYFDPDQLYDLDNDPHETNNLAANPGCNQMLNEMKQRLRKYIDTFEKPFPLDTPDTFFASGTFEQLKTKNLENAMQSKEAWLSDMRFIGFAETSEGPLTP